jgi:hypothetical protein
VPHFLNLGGVHAGQDHITLLIECADDCQSMAEGDEQMTACAEACRRCAKTCSDMASMSTMSS